MSVDPSAESTWETPMLMTTTSTTTTTMTSNNKSSRDYEASSSSSFPLRASTSAVPCTTTQSPSAFSSTSLSVSAPSSSPSMLTERRKREREDDTTTQPTHFKLSKNTPLNQPMISNLAYEVLLKGIETMRDYAIFVLNPDGTVASWNKGAENIKGFTSEEIIGKHFSAFYDQEAKDKGQPQYELNAALEFGRFEDEGWRLRKDGTQFWASVIITPIYDETGTLIGYAKVTRNLTERKKLEEERLLAVEQAKSEQRLRSESARIQERQREFTDRICHEIRNPLNGIYGNLELMNESLVELQKLTKSTLSHNEVQYHLAQLDTALKSIRECAEHQQAIADEVLRLSELESHQIVLHLSHFDPRVIIDSVVNMFRAAAEKKNLQIRVDSPKNRVIQIYNDAARLKEILINLVSNAIKFTEKGDILITEDTCYLAGMRFLRVGVQDTGVGMTEEEQSRLYQRFSHSSSVDYKQYGGSGLGLLISKTLIVRMGGTISVESTKGKGTKFTFTIRSDSAGDELSQCAAPAPANNAVILAKDYKKFNASILVVEDNLINQRVLEAQLHSMGCKVTIANNGVEAVEKTNTTLFDLILMDISMPQMNGLEAAKKIRSREQALGLHKTPIIALSGNAQEKDKKASLEVGMTDYLTKPFRKSELYGHIMKFLEDKAI
eukprot:TRINITY_DN961_c0_g4_i1.p1 TRINITY_DN961_c0_g4~~TRINITY_DN961_c0_g4_i1.p1  ORF type:complete len:666 (+),score=158.48 TRINITY_DN961_c0_g4_i1:338-2335(+)